MTPHDHDHDDHEYTDRMAEIEEIDEEVESHTRRRVLAGTVAAVIAASTPASAESITTEAVDDTLSEAALENAKLFPSGVLLEAVESAGLPTWMVEYEEGGLESLEEWADGDDDREILDTHEASRTAVVRATAVEIGATFLARLLDRGLAARSYVETIDVNAEHELIEPVDLKGETEAWPDYSRLDTWLTFDGNEPPEPDGVAFDDVETSPMSEARAATWSDDLDDEPTIAVVDSGLNSAGGDLFGDGGTAVDGAVDGTRILEAGRNVITGETIAEDGMSGLEDGNGHGTFVAAQVAGTPPDADHEGVLPNARILPIRALDDRGSGSTADIAEAIRYAADEGADSIVLSLGSPMYSTELDRALSYAAGAGSIPVAAVGNDRMVTTWLATPSSSDRAIAVASTTAGLDDEPIRSSYYSNVGPHPGTTDLSGGESADATVDVGAPGHKIETTVATTGGSLETDEASGTSMSAPIVGAIVGALVDRGEVEAGDVEGARELLQDSAEPVEECAEAEVGAGLVDAGAALAGTEKDDDMVDVMTTEALGRDSAYRGRSASQGGGLW